MPSAILTDLRTYAHNILVDLDCLASALLFGASEETISSRLGKAQRDGKRFACVFCRVLDLLQKDHCAISIEDDRGGDRLTEY